MHPSLKILSRSIAAAVLVLGSTTACSGGSHDKAGTTITYWANPMTATPQQHAAVLRPLLEEFTKQTGITVDLQMQDWSKVYPKIISGIASDSLPDVFDTGSTWAAALQATGGLEDFDDQAFDAIGGREKFLATSLAATGVPGPTSAVVPLYGQAYGLIYNPAMFAKAHIASPPTTWDELVADAKKLTGGGRWGFAYGGNASVQMVHQAFILGRQNGARFFSATGEPTFDSQAVRTGLRRLLDLMAVDHVIDPAMIEKSGIDAATAFARGKTGMMFAQSAVVGFFKTLKFTDYAVAQVPVPQPLPNGGSPVQSIVAGTNLAISKDGKHRAAALALVKFLTSTEAQTKLNTAFGTLPVLKSLLGRGTFADPTRKVFGEIQAFHSEPMPLVPAEGAMETALGTTLVKLWPKAEAGTLTDADIGEALRDAEGLMPR